MRLLSRKEYEEFVRNAPKDRCFLCSVENQILLGQSECWYWIANLSPYWKWHTMLIPKRHITDIADLTKEEFEDYQSFHWKIHVHLLGLGLRHDDGKKIDQFITMIRTRFENVENGSTYYKPNHLHIHIVPDREGVSRFVLDESAVNVEIQRLAL